MLQPGDVLAGRFEIQRLLGEGSRKRTFLAHDRKRGGLVALAVVKAQAVASDPERTEREAKILGRVGHHDSIVSLYDYEIDRDSLLQYIEFQYLPGGTLADHLNRLGQQSLEDILRLGRGICQGLNHLHGRGLIHRDVSPSNIFLDERGEAHLGDFDAAVAVDTDGPRPPLTTDRFAAPEDQEGQSLDVRCDLFSFGGVLCVMATARERPSDSKELASLRPDLPSLFVDLVGKLRSRSPDDRPADGHSVLEALDEIRQTSDVEALIAAGESDTIEFKSSIYHLHGDLPPDFQHRVKAGVLTRQRAEDEVRRELRREVTKTVAAFLNSDGGTLLIGVDDSGKVLGIESDFKYLGRTQTVDRWLLSLRSFITNALEPSVWNSIRASLVPIGPVTVAVVSCAARETETWYREGEEEEHFYIRGSNATQELKGSSVIRYIREHWPV